MTRHIPSPRGHRFPRGGGRRGFTLAEVLVSLVVLAFVILGILALFDSANQLAVTQLNRVDMQQSLRVGQREIGRMIRLAGRGGLPAGTSASKLPKGAAIAIDNNVAAGTDILNDGSSPAVVEGSDVLKVRGVFNTTVYLVEYPDPASFNIDIPNTMGNVTIRNVTPIGNVPQDLQPLKDMIASATRPEALVLVSPFSEAVYGVAEIDYGASVVNADSVVLGFRYDNGTYAAIYATLSSGGVFPDTIFSQSRVGSVGIVEEYRFYLRRGTTMDDPGEVATPMGDEVRRLSRARTYPGVDAAYDGDVSNLRVDIAENVIDFQVALAVDTDNNGDVTESADGVGDEWFGNSLSDKETDPPWVNLFAGTAPLLRFLRLTTLARTAQGDRGHMSQELDHLEDHVFSSSDPLNDPLWDRRFQRIVLRTSVEIRNL